MRWLQTILAITLAVSPAMMVRAQQADPAKELPPLEKVRAIVNLGPRFKTVYINDPAVQKDIGVTAAQQQQLDALLNELAAQAPARFTGPPFSLRDDGRVILGEFGDLKQRRERFEKLEKLREKEDVSLRAILDAKQYERLNQLELQRNGAGAFVSDVVAAKLGLTTDQRLRIRERCDELSAELKGLGDMDLREFMTLSRAERSQRHRKERQIQREASERAMSDIVAMLTAQQRETWQQMIGKKFEVTVSAALAPLGDRLPEQLGNETPEQMLVRSPLGVSPKTRHCRLPAVQKELAVTDEQSRRLKSLFADLAAEAVAVPRMPPPSADAELVDRVFEQHCAKRDEILTNEDEALHKILTPLQYERLNQIDLQDRGPFALADNEVAEKLALTEKQLLQVRTRCAGLQAEMSRIDRSGVWMESIAKSAQMHRAARDRALADLLGRLTAEQCEIWQRMVGKKFDANSP